MVKGFSFNWPLIIGTTGVLYLLIILTLPLSNVAATIMLFSLIAFWSRLPGVCIYEPISIIYLTDFVDIFSIIIALFVGPVQGATFSLIWNLYPRLCGPYHTWPALMKDSGIQAIMYLLCPIFYAITGSLVAVVAIYSILRLFLFWIVSIFLPTRGFIEQTIRLVISGIALFFINMLYVKLFGNFFTNLLGKGATFSWSLFLIATIIILIFSITVLGFSPKKTTKKIGKRIIKIVKNHSERKHHQTTNQDTLKKEIKEMESIKQSINNPQSIQEQNFTKMHKENNKSNNPHLNHDIKK